LKVFRAMISREALRPTAPTPETEAANPPTEGNPTFFRPVPPFNWHKKWSGTSWTWGPTQGNRGWEIQEMEETDAWQGITPVESWNLRLPGGIHVQCPRVITDANVAICRLAWLPDDETLLRVEAGVQALQPMLVEDDMMVGFEPPTLASLRCDMMKKTGELENVPRPSRDWKEKEDDDSKIASEEETDTTSAREQASAENSATSPAPDSKSNRKSKPDSEPDSGLDAIRDALSL